uniref:Uncharacterized protein n=1 Tax=Palpitomonas bilix TaxID=652834 RepID=A0A7S3D590_9EUKA
MNIFFLHANPRIAARMHCTKHVVKMALESAQLLCNVHWQSGGKAPYKNSRSGHAKLGPMIWLKESIANYRWTVELGLELCTMYKEMAKHDRPHASEKVLMWCKENEPSLADTGLTPPRLAMPDEYKDEKDAVASYRRYYYGDKKRFAVWPPGCTPAWWLEAEASGMEAKELWREPCCKGEAKGGVKVEGLDEEGTQTVVHYGKELEKVEKEEKVEKVVNGNEKRKDKKEKQGQRQGKGEGEEEEERKRSKKKKET